MVCYFSNLIVYFLGYMREKYSVPICFFILPDASTLNMLSVFLNIVTWLTLLVIDLVLYLGVPVLSTLM